MRKFLLACVVSCVMVAPTVASSNDLAHDTSDPLFLQADEEILTKTSIAYWDHILRVGQSASYGLNNRVAIGANVHYQHDFNGDEDGFAAIDLGGVYRMGTADDSNSHIISDVLFGFKFGGSSEVRTPDYADSTYYVGLRFGRQWAGMTLSATVKSTWVFDDERGVAFLDFTPESYFRIAPEWRLGAGLTIRKATHKDPIYHTDYDQEWLHMKLVRQYGRTQYVGHIDYEFESDEAQVGAYINILF
ncbi:MAG: hypothetical protein J6K82_02995 [Alphaproteobacteria bacterium]|nr:hypothetical protein [Alphaproteobacteria bacterium]